MHFAANITKATVKPFGEYHTAARITHWGVRGACGGVGVAGNPSSPLCEEGGPINDVGQSVLMIY